MYIRFEKGKLPMTGEDELKLIGKNARFELSLPETGARELVPARNRRRKMARPTGDGWSSPNRPLPFPPPRGNQSGPPRTLCAERPFPAAAPSPSPAQRKRAAPSNWPAAPTRSPSSPTPPTQPPMRSWPQPPPDRSYGASARMREPLSGACGSGRHGSLPMRAGERRRAGARAPSFRAGKRTRPQRDSANSGSAAETSGRSEFPE